MPITTLPQVTEGQTAYITISFEDELGVAITPSAFTYYVNDLLSGTQLATGTVSSPGVSSYVFTLTPDMNNILNNTEALEEHVLTIDATYEGSKHVTGDYHWNVENLEFLP
jgi:hypothetical protein